VRWVFKTPVQGGHCEAETAYGRVSFKVGILC
jgi:hypothetical protein